MKFPSFKNELQALANGHAYAAGCDEVGMGPIAGPVVAAACILDPQSINGNRSKSKWYYRVRDSKTTYEHERDSLEQEVKQHCLAFGVSEVSPEMVDKINIHQAAMLAMKQAVCQMTQSLREKTGQGQAQNQSIHLFLDGRFIIKEFSEFAGFNVKQQAVIDADALILSVSAASIIAKCYRDNILRQFDSRFPAYGFARHKGYNTKEHRAAIKNNGVTEFHRRSFLRNFGIQFER